MAAGVDPERLCGCVADRVLEGKNAGDLGELRPGSAEVRAAVAQCAAEIKGTDAGSWIRLTGSLAGGVHTAYYLVVIFAAVALLRAFLILIYPL